jgi:methyltransferase-like protein/SAM-dependent methyltransferase
MSKSNYDQMPYPNLSHSYTHPDKLATHAMLLGMKPAKPDSCRVLEIGCAGGINLSGMALVLPGSSFVGIDNSAAQIEEAHNVASVLNLKNLTFKHMDILEVDSKLGQFDYIIAHGIYSWVPPQVRDKLLEICTQNLAPQGIAYISYNTYPGWHTLGMMRDMMLYHTRNTDDPMEVTAQSTELIEFLADAVAPNSMGGMYKDLFKIYASVSQDRLTGWRDEAAMLHDELSEYNDPLYFHQFVEHASRHNLQYLTEIPFSTVIPNDFPPEVVQRLQQMSGSLIDMEQYMDFLRNRTLRRTLLCHSDVQINRQLSPALLQSFYAESITRHETDPENPDVMRFFGSDGTTFATDHPITKAAMQYLSKIFPQSADFNTLFTKSCEILGIATPQPNDAAILAASLLQAFSYSLNLAEFHAYEPDFTTTVSSHPIASPLARHEVQFTSLVSSLLHTRVKLDAVGQCLLPHLDGEHDREMLLAILIKLAQGGLIVSKVDGEQIEKPENLPDALGKELDSVLRFLAKSALLVG